jgi:hypothetical protein
MPEAPDHVLALVWKKGAESASLEVDLQARRASIHASTPAGQSEEWAL